jgi:pepF/M3 family oligoendopeptidase
MATAAALPHWDMTVVYPSLEAPQFLDAFGDVTTEIDNLAAFFDAQAIAKRDPAPLTDAQVQAFEQAVARYNALLERVGPIRAFINGFVSTNSRDDLAQARLSELQQQFVQLHQLDTRLVAWIGSLDVESLIARSAVAAEYAFLLREAKEEARHQMSPAEEDLAADLGPTGASAWGRLHSNLTSQIMVQIEGEPAPLPMSVVRNRAMDPAREVRRRAHEAELVAWQGAAVPLAAALNSIKGQVNALSRRRGWAAPLDEALFDNRIDRQTLDAMLEAAYASFPDFRRYMRAKARALGLSALAWYDLNAPVGKSERVWSYDEAERFIAEQFASFSPRLEGLATRAFGDRWIDAEPRQAKVGGGFCMYLREDESRILVNYAPNFDAVHTLAHELGHAYHNFNLARRPYLQRATPMTLAETASIFCETIIHHAGLARADAREQLALLETSISGQMQVVVDITSRFLFEQRVFERRLARELSVDELCGLMLETQRETYGDGLDQELLHPYMWAAKGHYYSTRSFYNYPYMFGLLFGLGLYARYQRDPEQFKAGYDDLLSSTGMADATTLAARFGIDIRTPDFWHASLDVIRADIDRFEALVAAPHHQ